MQKILVSDSWEHLFPGKKVTVRFALDVSEVNQRAPVVNDFISMGIKGRAGWRMAFRAEAADVLDSLVNGNPDLLASPESYGLTVQAAAPDWDNKAGGVSLV